MSISIFTQTIRAKIANQHNILSVEKEEYKIKITDTGIVPTESYRKFSTDRAIFKIYIVKHNSTILYVGMTKQRISVRFGQSFRAYKQKLVTGESNSRGDSGYKWILKHRNTEDHLELFVFPFSDETEKHNIEAVEAEIAFLVKIQTGRWPECQNEIHFHNIDGVNADKQAKAILKIVCNWDLD